ncbi:hypothetical protein C8J57DRAFT_1245887 [Mycena rebaudengoi]|nr:hypothetical protein C8J57DRAFT_1245887 [Mycena rebaudengoi]
MSNLANSVCGLYSAWDLGLLPAMVQDLYGMIVLATSGGKKRKNSRCLLLFGLFTLLSSLVFRRPVFPAPVTWVPNDKIKHKNKIISEEEWRLVDALQWAGGAWRCRMLSAAAQGGAGQYSLMRYENCAEMVLNPVQGVRLVTGGRERVGGGAGAVARRAGDIGGGAGGAVGRRRIGDGGTEH